MSNLGDRMNDFEWIKVVNGWTFDPSRQVWWARTGLRWVEVKGALDDPPTWPPPPKQP